MKPERAFVAERIAAQHCPELLRANAATPADLRPLLERVAAKFARALPAALAPLLGAPPRVSATPARESDAGTLAVGAAPLAAFSLLTAEGTPVLATIEAGAVLRIVDKAYGGRGEAPDPLPDAFPLSAELMIARLEALVIDRLAAALECEVAALRRDASLAQLAPFADGTALVLIDFAIEEEGREPWTLGLAFARAGLAGLLGAEPGPARKAGPRGPASPLAEPYADLPMELTATVIDMRMPFPTVAKLRPGQLLPVAVARAVPLSIGGRIVAHGTIGALDDRVAIQLTKAFQA